MYPTEVKGNYYELDGARTIQLKLEAKGQSQSRYTQNRVAGKQHSALGSTPYLADSCILEL